MEASALQASAGLTRNRVSIGLPLLRLRSDEQLVALFRGGNDEAFRVIHDRYRQRLFAYTRQMLPGSGQDAEDALQDVFVRAYASLRASNRDLALRAWLYRVAHNRCIDELRRAPLPTHDVIDTSRVPARDPIAEAEQREALKRLIEDVRRLPAQQRSALLMRELSGMSYAELAAALCVSVPAVKSLLVRARIGLAKALEARETACSAIHEELVLAHDRGVRPSGTVRRHLRDCEACREFRGEVRGLTRQFAALVPALGPAGMLAKLMGIGGGAGASGSAAAGGGAAMAGGAAGTGGLLTAGGLMATGATHVATLLAAAVITAGGAVDLANSIVVPVKHQSHHHAAAEKASGVMPTAAHAAPSPPATAIAADPGPSPASVAPATVTPDRAASVTPHPGPARHPTRGDSDPSAGPALPGSLDSGTFGIPPATTSGGAQAPSAGTGSGSDPVGSDNATAGGTSVVATGPNGSPISSPSGSPTGTGSGSGSPASATPGASGSSTGTPVSTGPQPIASSSSAGSNSTGSAGGSAPGAPSPGGPSSSTTG